MEEGGTTANGPAGPSTQERILRFVALAIAVGISITIFMLRGRIEQLAQAGTVGWFYTYAGVFLISMAVSATIILPAPGWLIFATLGATLNPFLVGIVSALGATVGELTGYLLGYSGRATVKNVSLDWKVLRAAERRGPRPTRRAAAFLRGINYDRMAGWMNRRGGWLIFILALIPNPLFDVAGAAAGALRMPVWKFMLYGSLGRIPKHLAYAYAGNVGITLFGCFRP